MENIAIQWAIKLGFSEDWLAEIRAFLPSALSIPYDRHSRKLKKLKNPMQNLVSYLEYCSLAEQNHKKLGIPEDIMMATLDDIRLWAYKYRIQTGNYGLMEINWTYHMVEADLFRLGRLQFAFGWSKFWFPSCGIYPFSPVLDIHIPSHGGRMTPEAVDQSLAMAEEFFPKYFPNFKYRGFVCSSWLLTKNMHLFLDENSNIRRFSARFKNKIYFINYCVTHHLYNMGVNRRNLKDYQTSSKFQEDIKQHILSGGKMYFGIGAIPSIHNKKGVKR